MMQRLREEREKRNLLFDAITAIVIVSFGTLVWFVFSNWTWTAFGEYTTKRTIETTSGNPPVKTISEIQSGKTLWDGLQLVGVPVVLALGGYLLNQREQARTEERERQASEPLPVWLH